MKLDLESASSCRVDKQTQGLNSVFYTAVSSKVIPQNVNKRHSADG